MLKDRINFQKDFDKLQEKMDEKASATIQQVYQLTTGQGSWL